MIYAIRKYQGELFHNCSRRIDSVILGTYDEEKAQRFGIDTQETDNLPYVMEVPYNETEHEKSFFPPLYQIIYKNHFFLIAGEKKEEVKLLTPKEFLAMKYGLKLEGDPRSYRFVRLVPRKKITPVTETTQDIGFIAYNPLTFENGSVKCDSSSGMVCHVVCRGESHTLMKAPSIEELSVQSRQIYLKESWNMKMAGWYYGQVPNEKIYFYRDHDETFRY